MVIEHHINNISINGIFIFDFQSTTSFETADFPPEGTPLIVAAGENLMYFPARNVMLSKVSNLSFFFDILYI